MKPLGKYNTPRNRVAVYLANACLRLASADYRNFLEAVIWYGMSAAAENVIKQRPHPVSWTHLLSKTDNLP